LHVRQWTRRDEVAESNASIPMKIGSAWRSAWPDFEFHISGYGWGGRVAFYIILFFITVVEHL